jgi:hypothetical protein
MNKHQPVRKCAGSNSFNGFHMCKERKVDRKKQGQKNAMSVASDRKKTIMAWKKRGCYDKQQLKKNYII